MRLIRVSVLRQSGFLKFGNNVNVNLEINSMYALFKSFIDAVCRKITINILFLVPMGFLTLTHQSHKTFYVDSNISAQKPGMWK